MPLLVCVCLPVIVLALQVWLLCESPTWLIMQNKTKKAKDVIRFMYPTRSEEDIELIYAEYEYTLGKEAEKKQLVCFNIHSVQLQVGVLRLL